MMNDIDLSGLRDIHLMTEPSWWPLATGWWVVLGFVLFLLIMGYILFLTWHNKPVVYAVRKVHHMAKNIDDDLIYLKNLSKLLKRVAIAGYGRSTIAPLTEVSWQNFLLKKAPDSFTKTEAHLIALAPYETTLNTPFDRELMTQHAELWIKKVLKDKKSS